MIVSVESLLERFARWGRGQRRPRILLLVDYKGWAFDHSAREIARQLRNHYRFVIKRVHSRPKLNARSYDLVYVFFWGETYHQQFGFDPDRTIKEVSSHRWADDPRFGPCTPQAMADKYMGDAGTVICTSSRLVDAFQPCQSRVFHTPNGIDPVKFRLVRERSGPLTIGWAGDIEDPVKGVNDILKPACEGRFSLLLAPGRLSHKAMNEFYNRVDVLAVASKNEGEPLTLLEGMAAGCFPVCADVGIVPEVVRNGENGLIVPERSVDAFRTAFAWCEAHLDQVRTAGRKNAVQMQRERNWGVCAENFKRVFQDTLAYARRPRFRNDDVSADTDLERFREFCAIFQRHGIEQLHGITLRGRTNSNFKCEEASVEYEGLPDLGKLPNSKIRDLSAGFLFEERQDLIDYLQNSTDQVALHGYYHTDYSMMTASEQREEISRGMELLARLFPHKRVRYFIAPFNRTNAETFAVVKEFGLTVLAADGVHMEEHLYDFHLEPETWYRYHHHRFYPESTFPHWCLSLNALETALARNFATCKSPATMDCNDIGCLQAAKTHTGVSSNSVSIDRDIL
jgi:glycosyltransferase involved in cell wall biosynthesis